MTAAKIRLLFAVFSGCCVRYFLFSKSHFVLRASSPDDLRWNGTLYMDQKVCLSLVKKDQMCAIALVNRKLILKVLLKMVAMATSHSLFTSLSIFG